MPRGRGKLALNLATAAVITGVGASISGHFNMAGYREVFITVTIIGFLAGFASGERLSILVAPLVVWGLNIADAWLHPSHYGDALQQILPWNILFTEDGATDLVTILIPLDFFAFIGWLCRAAPAWGLDRDRRPLGETLRGALRASPGPLALLLDLFALLMVPIMPFFAVPICITLLIVGSVLLAKSPDGVDRASGAIMSTGGLVMIPALAVVFRSFFGL